MALCAVHVRAQDDPPTELKPAGIFTDMMVLQKDTELPIWGEDSPGNKIKVSIAGQTLNAVVDKNGRWKVLAAPLKETGPFQMEIESESGKLVYKDILCGEVWIFAGDSAIGRPLGNVGSGKQGSGGDGQIRMFNVPRQFAKQPYDEIKSKWVTCGPTDSAPAVPYCFARELQGNTNVPVGLIILSVSGTVSEAWIGRDVIGTVKELTGTSSYDELIMAYENKISGLPSAINPLANPDADSFSSKNSGAVKRLHLWTQSDAGKGMFKSEAEMAKWEEKIQDWVDVSLRCEAHGEPVSELQKTWPIPIQMVSGLIADPRTSPTRPAALFNGMVNPIVPYAVKGVVLWNGETDAAWDRGDSYFNIVTGLIKSWRTAWNKAQAPKKTDMPFLLVQLQNFRGKTDIPTDACSKIRAAQALVPGKVSNTATAVTMDLPLDGNGMISTDGLGEAGQRIAWGALGKFYGRKIPYSGPVFESTAYVGGQISVKFKFDDNGLIAGRDGKAGKVTGFETANAEGNFSKADAEIGKDSILINNPGDIVTVRYGWGLDPDANLYSKEVLPTSPFQANLPERK